MRESFDDEDDENEDLGFSAINKYEQMIAENGTAYFDVEEIVEIVEFYMEDDDLESGLEACEFGLNQHANEATLMILKSEIYLDLDQSRKALETLQKAVSFNPCNSEVFTAIGSMYSRLKSPKEAIYYYEKALVYVTEEEKEEVLFDIAFEYQNLRQFYASLKYFTKIIEENPNNETAMFEIGLCYSELDRDDEAIKFFNEYLDLHPYSYIGWFNLANSYMKKEMFDEAIFAFDYSIIINEFFPTAYYGKANGFIQKKEYEKAILVLNETFGLEQPHTFVYCSIGECYEKMEQYDKALTYYEKSIELDKNYPDAWVGMAVVYKLKEQFEKSLKHIDKAIKLDATNIDYLSVKAEIYEDLKEYDKAIAIYESIIKIEPSDVDTWFNYGALLGDMEEFDVAIDILEKGFELTQSTELFFKMTAVSFDAKNDSLGLSLLKKGLTKYGKDIAKFYEYFPNFAENVAIMELINKNKDL